MFLKFFQSFRVLERETTALSPRTVTACSRLHATSAEYRGVGEGSKLSTILVTLKALFLSPQENFVTCIAEFQWKISFCTCSWNLSTIKTKTRKGEYSVKKF